MRKKKRESTEALARQLQGGKRKLDKHVQALDAVSCNQHSKLKDRKKRRALPGTYTITRSRPKHVSARAVHANWHYTNTCSTANVAPASAAAELWHGLQDSGTAKSSLARLPLTSHLLKNQLTL